MTANRHRLVVAGTLAGLMCGPAWATEVLQRTPLRLVQIDMGTTARAPVNGQQQATSQSAHRGGGLYERSPEELHRVEVLDAAGEKVGRVKAVVLGPDHASAYVVVSSGGFLGFGARELILSLDELRVDEDDGLRAGALKDVLLARDDYVPEDYVELGGDRPISELSAFAPLPDLPPTGAGSTAPMPSEQQ